jgi:hypothetical protein
MIAYQKEKIKNAIAFFAKEHRKHTKQYLYQTFLYKYLGFLDLDGVAKNGIPVLGLTYRAMDRGPVPIEIYEKRKNYKTDLFYFKNIKENNYIIVPKDKKPNLDYFSKNEIDEMYRLIEIYANRFVSCGDVSEASHQEIKAWKKAYKQKPNSIIDYDLCFEENINDKPEEELTPPEESYRIHKTIEYMEKV